MILIHLLVCLIYLLILICLLGDSTGMYHSKCKRNFEDIFNRAKNISKSPRLGDTSITVIYIFSIRFISYCSCYFNIFTSMKRRIISLSFDIKFTKKQFFFTMWTTSESLGAQIYTMVLYIKSKYRYCKFICFSIFSLYVLIRKTFFPLLLFEFCM